MHDDPETGEPSDEGRDELRSSDEREVALSPIGRTNDQGKSEEPDRRTHQLSADAIERNQRGQQSVDSAELMPREGAILQEKSGGVERLGTQYAVRKNRGPHMDGDERLTGLVQAWVFDDAEKSRRHEAQRGRARDCPSRQTMVKRQVEKKGQARHAPRNRE